MKSEGEIKVRNGKVTYLKASFKLGGDPVAVVEVTRTEDGFEWWYEEHGYEKKGICTVASGLLPGLRLVLQTNIQLAFLYSQATLANLRHCCFFEGLVAEFGPNESM